MAVPVKDENLAAYAANVNAKIETGFATYGYTSAQATQFGTLYDAFTAARAAVLIAQSAGTRSSPLIEAKNFAKAELLRFARELYSLCQASLTVPNERKIELGITIRKTEPTPSPVPGQAPAIDFISAVGNTVLLRLHDSAEGGKKGKPPFVAGAAIFSAIGAAPPTTESDWTFQGITGKTLVNVTFPDGTAPGSRVWFTAYWFNNAKQRGPSSPPMGCNLPGGAAMAA